MKSNLYPCFKWPGTVWLYSDPHFGDVELYTWRGMNCKISDEEQIRRIHSKIGKNDTLVILGDVGDIEWVKKIRGYKVLIQGNHDVGASKYKRTDSANLFDEVYEGCLMISDRIILSHEPVDFKYAFNIHGHDHSGAEFMNYVLKDYDCDIPSNKMQSYYLETIRLNQLKHLNVCAEWIGYYPICLTQIIKSGILANTPDVHRETIDVATARRRRIEQ